MANNDIINTMEREKKNEANRRWYAANQERMRENMRERAREYAVHVPNRTRGQKPRTTPQRVPAPTRLTDDDRAVMLAMSSTTRKHWYAKELAIAANIEESRCERVLLRLYAAKLVRAHCHAKGHRPFTWVWRGELLAVDALK